MADRPISTLRTRAIGWLVAGATVVSAALHLGGLQKNLPYAPEVDESMRVSNSLHIAVTGNLNPHWFGHPGTTTFYPMAGLYYAWGTAGAAVAGVERSAFLRKRFAESPWEFYLIGRLLSAAYSVLTIPAAFLLGRRAFGTRAGAAGAWLMVFCRLNLYYGTTVRTDSAAAFFGMVSLWLCFRVLERPTRLNHLLAGLAIGLALASRFFMIALVPVLALADLLVFLRTPGRRERAELAYNGLLGLLAAAATFVIMNPYFFLDAETAGSHVQGEARVAHPGADGLSRAGNFAWYLLVAIPQAVTWPQAVLAGLGLVLVTLRPSAPRLVLAGYVMAFLAAISMLPLHWPRWIIQVLPIVALLSAFAAEALVEGIGLRLRLEPARRDAVLAIGVAALVAWPAGRAVRLDILMSRPSTQVQAREWIRRNVPAGASVAQDFYAAPIDDLGYRLATSFSLSYKGTVEDYRRQGVEYLVTCSLIYKRFYAEPDRYPAQVAFYESLAKGEELAQEFAPSAFRGGPTLRIYRLRKP